MKIPSRLGFLTISGVFLAAAFCARALDATHIITVALRATAESVTVVRGDNLITTPVSSRISTADVIDAIGDAKGIVFNNRARLLLVRRNVGEETESSEVLVRQLGLVDCNADDMVIFTPAEGSVLYGTFNTVTGRERTTLLYIANLRLALPGTADFLVSGPSTEKRSSVRLGGQEINAGLSSLGIKLAGDGLIFDDGEIFVVLDGTMNIGLGKFD